MSISRASGTPPAAPTDPPADLKLLKRLLWLYLALWVFEGSLRKWIFPHQASPLLVVRDPVLLLMYALALAKGVFPRGAFMVWIGAVSFVSLLFSLIGTKAPLLVQMYGYRSDFLHLPLVFLIPNLIDRDDLRKIGRWTLLLALPMSFLVMLQFGAGPGARINVGVGGEGGMLEAAYGHIRPSGTFSFSNGLAGFVGIVTAFCAYGALEKKVFPRLIWLASVPALAAMIMLSGSRTLVGMVLIVLAAVGLSCLFRPRFLVAAAKIGGVCGLGALGVGSFAVLRQGIDVIAYRFGDAENVQEGFVDRFFGMFMAPFRLFDVVDFYGVGLGMGTNVGAGILLEGQRAFLYSEGELGRVMFESGPVAGPIYLLLRVAIVLYLLRRALSTLRRDGHPLPLLLLSVCCVDFMVGQFGQATMLGYATIAAGLCLAANRPGASELAAMEAASPVRVQPLPPLPPSLPRPTSLPGRGLAEPQVKPPPPPPPTARALPRGRSAYAEQMHREGEVRMQNAEVRSPEGDHEPSE